MLDRSLKVEFESYRDTLPTDEVRRAFDERIERLLSQRVCARICGRAQRLSPACRCLARNITSAVAKPSSSEREAQAT